MALGTIPQLNTGGGDYSNALRGVMQAERLSRQDARADAQAGRQEELFGLQKQKLTAELDPEVVALKKQMQKLDVDTKSALANRYALENKKASAKFVANQFYPYLGATDNQLIEYSNMYNKFLKDRELAPHVKAYAPNPADFLKPDLNGVSVDGKPPMSVPKEDMKRFQQQLTGIVAQADALSKGQKGGKSIPVYGTGGRKSYMQWVPAGESFTPPDGYELTAPKEKKEPGQITRQVEGEDGKIYTAYGIMKDGKFVEQSRVSTAGVKKAKSEPADVKVVRTETKDELDGTTGLTYRTTFEYDKDDNVISEKRVEVTEDTLTPQQKIENKRKDTNKLTALGDSISGVDDEGVPFAIDKEGNADAVRQYNELAEKLELPDRYEWSEEGISYEVPGAIYGTNTKTEPGYVRVKAGKTKDDVNGALEEFNADILQEYKRMYPGRTDAELEAAYNKLRDAGGM
jgi:hypothetical protein